MATRMSCSRQLLTLGRSTLKLSTAPSSPIITRNCSITILQPSLLSRVSDQFTGKRNISIGRCDYGPVLGKEKLNSNQANDTLISNAKPDNAQRMLQVKWGDGSSDRYPYIWLRDNCQCPECYHTSSRNRMLLIKDLQLSVSPVSITVNEGGREMEIKWSDGHRAYYESSWLQIRSFKETKRAERLEVIQINRQFWGSEIAQNLPRGSYPEALQKDDVLLDVLQHLEEFGLVVLDGAPLRVGQVETLSDRVGFVRKTPYGETFAVKSKVDANNLAYTANTLDLHVDLAHLTFKPGVQILHCIAQTPGDGGETLFVDGFHVANQLKELHPDQFNILANTPVAYKDEGTKEAVRQTYTVYQVPMICLDQTGSIEAIVSSNLMRDSFFNVPVEKVNEWYQAMITFDHLLSQPENMISYKMKEGDMVLFDNTRILHGRMAYQVTQGERELEGGYWDWDLARSCRRVLQLKLKGTMRT